LLAALAVVRPALVPGLAGLGILLASAALDGPVPRYRYPLDPLIALFAAGALTVALSWALALWRRTRPTDARRREPPRKPAIASSPSSSTSSSPVPEASR
jgi:hypothetical protein